MKSLPLNRRRTLILMICAITAGFLGMATQRGMADDSAGFQSIFNGKDLDGWDGNPKFWSVRDGAIVGQTTKENPTDVNTFCIWRQGTVDDFILRLSFKIDGGNSGVQYRSEEFEKWRVKGYQADFDSTGDWAGVLYEEAGRGVLSKRGSKTVLNPEKKPEETPLGDPEKFNSIYKKGQWNEYELSAQGNKLTHKLNGQVVTECIDNDPEKRAMTGILALQLHAGDPMSVEFKDLRLKRLPLADGRKKIVLVAGAPSHPAGEHEFNAGTKILERCLNQIPGIVAAAYYNGWPADPTAFDNADSIMLYMDGGGGHPLLDRNRLAEIDRLLKRGVGLACLHYAVEVPKEKGGPDLLKWIGGFYERDYSINPHWKGRFTQLTQHPVTQGVEPFEIQDEWYYNMRWPDDQKNVKPLLVATPPDDTRGTDAAKQHPGRAEVVAWAFERPDGGRGFGFTGGHFHKNWGNDNFRKLVLNALLWTAKANVPTGGAVSSVSETELTQNLDKK